MEILVSINLVLTLALCYVCFLLWKRQNNIVSAMMSFAQGMADGSKRFVNGAAIAAGIVLIIGVLRRIFGGNDDEPTIQN